MPKSKLTLFALSLLALLAYQPEALAFKIAVSPMKFEVPLSGRPVTRSLKVINQGKTALAVDVSIGNWDLDKNNNLRTIAPNSQSLDQWIIASPLKLKIPAGKTRTIRFSIRPYVKPRIGEHRAIIYLDQGGAGTKGKKGVSFKFRIGVPVYGNAGKPVRFGSISGVVAKPTQIGFKIKNDGKFNVRFKGTYAIWKNTRFPGSRTALRTLAASGTGNKFRKPKTATLAGNLPSLPVLPGFRRTIPIKIDSRLKPGSYKIFLHGNLGDTPLNKSYSFTVH